MPTLLEQFDRISVINIVERTDRRREMIAQLRRVNAAQDPKLTFFAAKRPADAGNFPSVGARGCFESHLTVLREALSIGVERLLIVEDDFDFAGDIATRGAKLMAHLTCRHWDLFFGAPRLDAAELKRLPAAEDGLVAVPPSTSIVTASFVAFRRSALVVLEPYLTAMMARPPGSPDYGPMHVDGAYSVFRAQHPQLQTLIATPAIGHQRSSRSDISGRQSMLDRFEMTQPLANRLRRLKNWIMR